PFKAPGRRPKMAAADRQPPAANDPPINLGKQNDGPVFFSEGEKSPAAVCKNALAEAKKQARDILILDTAGRLHIAEDLMKELKAVKDAVNPDESLFVADAMTGQDAVNIAKTFNEQIGIDGIILTKMDGDARGGAALSIREVTGRPIKFIGTGEKIEMLEPFHPERAASRILGMGDVLSFIEKAQQSFDEKEALTLQNKLTTDSFTLDDLREQLKKIRSMGPIQNLLNMIPGFNRMKGVEVDESQFVKVEAMISSMTRKERNNPQILNGSRKLRISAGSGTTVADINRLLKQYKDMKKMMKAFKNKKGFRIPDIMPF
ncbi:MAG: signal recognition particle protein, partial [Nitrospirae bacterium]|nr:signal recognition particle protein [Nitrospirota bacterium]